uniref:Secreted protein n=1 Tax=Oryza nivara TaxID=4536 RepID=A0A0E0HMS1_ORYNI
MRWWSESAHAPVWLLLVRLDHFGVMGPAAGGSLSSPMNVCVPCTIYSHAQASAPTSVHATPQRACDLGRPGDAAPPRSYLLFNFSVVDDRARGGNTVVGHLHALRRCSRRGRTGAGNPRCHGRFPIAFVSPCPGSVARRWSRVPLAQWRCGLESAAASRGGEMTRPPHDTSLIHRAHLKK